MRKALDFSIPIEKLDTPEERYKRITMLNRKPYSVLMLVQEKVLNKYFKLFVLTAVLSRLAAQGRKTSRISRNCSAPWIQRSMS